MPKQVLERSWTPNTWHVKQGSKERPLSQAPPDPTFSREKLLIIKCYIWHVLSFGFLKFYPFSLNLWDKMQCGPANFLMPCLHPMMELLIERPSGGRAVVTSGDTCSSTNRLALPSPNSSLILLPELHVLPGHGLSLSALHSVTSSLVVLICQNLSLL